MKRLFELVFALASALIAGCGGGGGGSGSIPPSVTVTTPSTATIDATAGTVELAFDGSGCVQGLVDNSPCATRSTIISVSINSVSTGNGANSSAKAGITNPNGPTATVTIPGIPSLTNRFGLSVITANGILWFNVDRIVCKPIACTKVTDATGTYLQYGAYPGIDITNLPDSMQVTWDNPQVTGFSVNGVPRVLKLSDINNSDIFWASDKAGWPSASGTGKVGHIAINAAGTAQVIIAHSISNGEAGNFYLVLSTGETAWFNPNLLTLGDLHCSNSACSVIADPKNPASTQLMFGTAANGGSSTAINITITKLSDTISMIWNTKAVSGFLENGNSVVIDDLNTVQNTIYWESAEAWIHTDGTTQAVGQFSTASDGASVATIHYTAHTGEHGNFYMLKAVTQPDGSVIKTKVWLNLGLSTSGDLSCVGCTIDPIKGEITFN